VAAGRCAWTGGGVSTRAGEVAGADWRGETEGCAVGETAAGRMAEGGMLFRSRVSEGEDET